MFGEGMISLIAPFERDRVLGQLGDQVGILYDDIAPELHGSAVRLHIRVDFLEKVEVDAPSAALIADLLAATLTQIDCLVAADVEHAAGEVRQQFVVEAAHQLKAARIFWGEADWAFEPD